MICVDCGQLIPGFDAYPNEVDVCDKCLLKRYKNNPTISKHIPEGKSIEDISYKEASEILDKVGMIDFPIDKSIRDAIVIEKDEKDEEA